ncbi:MAG: hypothetical protein QOI41_1153 [Myxococcales bacterium]|nr:hypothetical protein [Myxococcales bacterium]
MKGLVALAAFASFSIISAGCRGGCTGAREQGGVLLLIDGAQVPVRKAFAATRGGRSIELVLGGAERSCADYAPSEHPLVEPMVILTIAPMLLVSTATVEAARTGTDRVPDAAPDELRVPTTEEWQLRRANWTRRGASNVGSGVWLGNAPTPTPGKDLARDGGRVAISFELSFGSPGPTMTTTSASGTIDVVGCGDRPERAVVPPLSASITIGSETLAVRGARTRNDGARRLLDLDTSFELRCTANDLTGDLSLSLDLGDAKTGSLNGLRVPNHFLASPTSFRTRVDDSPAGSGRVRVELGGAAGKGNPPITLAGAVIATECPSK